MSPFCERQPARGADGLLTAAKIDAARDHATSVERAEFLLENARLEHDAKSFEVAWVRRSFRLRF